MTLDLSKATQFGSPFGVTDLPQDGYAAGQLTAITVESNGIVMARYSNGQSKPAGQVELATFRNPQGLQPLGGNVWARTFASGDPMVGVPGDGNLGVLQAGALEESNVDLTAELVNMITAQRAYQANAQTIKTQDQVMQTLRQPALKPAICPKRHLRGHGRSGPLESDAWTAMIYLAMAGAKATLQRQDVLANNLANASTTGFRAELQAFRAVPVHGDGASTRVYALESTVGHDNRAGPVQATGRPLDVAIQGKAWLAVQALDGTEAYTRAGALQVNAEGQLVTPAGCRCWATAGRSRCRPRPRWTWRPTAASHQDRQGRGRNWPGG